MLPGCVLPQQGSSICDMQTAAQFGLTFRSHQYAHLLIPACPASGDVARLGIAPAGRQHVHCRRRQGVDVCCRRSIRKAAPVGLQWTMFWVFRQLRAKMDGGHEIRQYAHSSIYDCHTIKFMDGTLAVHAALTIGTKSADYQHHSHV